MQPDTPKIPEDPTLALQEAQAQKKLIDSLQVQAQGDTANLMARYGTRLALAGSGMTPMAGAAEAAPAAPGNPFGGRGGIFDSQLGAGLARSIGR